MQSLDTIRALAEQQQQNASALAKLLTLPHSAHSSSKSAGTADHETVKPLPKPKLSKSVVYHRNPEFKGPITDSAAWVEQLQGDLAEAEEEDPNLTQELAHGLSILTKVRYMLRDVDDQISKSNTILVDTHWELLSLQEEVAEYLDTIKEKWL